MQKLIIKASVLSLGILLCASILYASIGAPYDNSKSPKLSLPNAYTLAFTALGASTNQFHCVSATIQTRFSSNGEWFFTFYSTNSLPRWVTVEFSGKVHVQNMLPPE